VIAKVPANKPMVVRQSGSLVLREILCTVQYIGATGKYNFGSNGLFLYLNNLGNGF
jgi:hypothetical protein